MDRNLPPGNQDRQSQHSLTNIYGKLSTYGADTPFGKLRAGSARYFDFDPGFDVAFARVERTLLSATFDFDLDFHREGLGFGRAAIATKLKPAYSRALEAHRYEGLLKPETCESF
jgi:hypothetical protein